MEIQILEFFLIAVYWFLFFYFTIKFPVGTPAFLMFNIKHTWAMVSNLVLGSGLYMKEIREFSEWNNAVIIYLIYLLPFMVSFYFTLMLIQRQNINFNFKQYYNNIKKSDIYGYLLSVVLLILIIHTLWSGAPLLHTPEINRFNFWNQYAKLNLLTLFHNQIIFLMYAYFIFGKSSRLKGVVLSIAVIHYLLLGQKFTVLFLLIYYAFYSKLYIQLNPMKIKLKYVLMFLFLIGSFVILSLFHYEKEAALVGDNPFLVLVDRLFVLQGQMWWASVNYVQNIGIDIEKMFIYKEDGIQILMQLFAPDDIYLRYTESGVRFTMGYPGIIYISLEYWGVLYQTLQGFIFAMLTYMVFYLSRQVFVEAFLTIKIFFIYSTYLLMGNISDIISWKFLLWVYLLSFWILIKKVSNLHIIERNL